MNQVEKLLADSRQARDLATNYKVLAEVYERTAVDLEKQGLALIWSLDGGVEKVPVG